MPDQATVGLEEPLLETRQRAAPNGQGKVQPAQEIVEAAGDDPEKQPYLVGPKAVAGGPGPVAVVSGARISEMSFDQRVHAETLVQLTRQQQPRIGRHRGAPELDAKLGVEREANRARCRVTRWVVPSAPARRPQEPRFMRVLSNYVGQ